MEFDHIVIGAGVHGSAASYYLAKSGERVLLLERNQIASGASGGVGYRGVRANNRDIRELPLMAIAYDLWPDINAELSIEPGYQRIGGLELLGSDVLDDQSLREGIETRIAVQSSFGIPTELLDRAGLDELEPGSASSVAGAIHCPKDGVGDHSEVTRGYAAGAARLGAEVRENQEVVGIAADGDRYAVTTADGQVQHGAQVLVTANSYSRALLQESFGLDLPITRFNPQMTPVRAQSGFTFSHLLSHHSLPFAAKTIGDGQVMLSGGRTGEWDYDADEGRPRDETAQMSVDDAAELFAEFVDAEIVMTDASRADSLCVDGIPIIDEVPGHPGVHFSTGWSGHGFAISPAVGTLVAQWLTTGEKPPALEPFSLSRFAPS